jgi:hypothetical protein
MTGNVYKRRQCGWTAKTHTRPRLEAVPSVFKFVIQSMRYVPSLYDYILHVNVSYAWRSVLIMGRPNSVFSLARSLVRSPSRSPAARTAFVPRRRRDASIAHPPATITTWEGQKLTEYSYHLQIQASSFLLFSKHTSQTYRKCRTKYMWNGLVPLNYSYKKSYQRWREFEKRKRSQVLLLQRKTTPSSLPPNSIKILVSIGRLWLLAALLPTSNRGSVT